MPMLGRDISFGVLAVGVMVAYWPGLLDPVIAPRWVLLIAGAPMLMFGARSRDERIWLLPLASLFYAVLSIAWTTDPLAGTNGAVHLLVFLGIAYAAASIEDIRPLLLGLTLGLAINAVIVVLQTSGIGVVNQAVPPAGFFGNRNVLAELAAPILVWLMARRPWGFSLGIISGVLVLILTLDRAALVGMVAAIILFLPRPKRIMFLAAAAGALVVMTWLSPWGLSSLAQRIDILGMVSNEWLPWGLGIAAFGALHPDYAFVHCDPAQLLYELGIAALPLFIFAFSMLRRDNDERCHPERAALICLLVESWFSYPLQLPATLFLAAVLSGRCVDLRVRLRGLGNAGGIAVGAGGVWSLGDAEGAHRVQPLGRSDVSF